VGADASARFWSHVDRSAGRSKCWPWLAAVEKKTGYGRVRIGGRLEMAHRAAYTFARGPIPTGLTIDHVKARGCTRRDCVNPAHLEAVTLPENIRRSDAPNIVACRRGTCCRGHQFVKARQRANGGVDCPECEVVRKRASRARLAAAKELACEL